MKLLLLFALFFSNLAYSGIDISTPPFLFFNGQTQNFKKLKEHVTSFLDSPEGAQYKAHKELWLKALVNAGGSSYQWNQDFMESSFDPETGGPVLHEYEAYKSFRPEASVGAFSKAAKAHLAKCGFKRGPGFGKNVSNENANGYMGGNIEALPQGYCLVGNKGGAKDFSAVCPPDKTIRIETDWLHVGHVDEILSLIPVKAPPPGKCPYVISIASVDKALDLLKSKPNDLLFTGFYSGKHRIAQMGNSKTDHIQESDKLLKDPPAFAKEICSLLQKIKEAPHSKPENESDLHTKIFQLFNSFFLPHTHAGVEILLKSDKSCEPMNLYAGDFLKVYNAYPGIREAHKQIQESLNRSKEQLHKHFVDTYSCEPQFMEVPSLYSSSFPTTDKGSTPQKNLNALSVFPNPTNGVVSGAKYIGNHAINPGFAEDIEKSFEKFKIPVEFIFTQTGPHTQQGNIHCSTNVLRYCKARTKK